MRGGGWLQEDKQRMVQSHSLFNCSRESISLRAVAVATSLKTFTFKDFRTIRISITKLFSESVCSQFLIGQFIVEKLLPHRAIKHLMMMMTDVY